jgi:fatty-acyl-CoA synthase
MTEMSPLGSVSRAPAGATGDDAWAYRYTQGRLPAGVEARIVGPMGDVMPSDAEAVGELEVRGPWVAKSYFGDEGKDRWRDDGWFKTGDVVTIDGEGYVTITDRSKDVIKSGGEWISSVTVENALMSHPAVLEAAVFAGRHPKWDERPIAAIVLKPNQRASKDELSAFLKEKSTLVSYAVPDDYVFIDQIPRTSTGKFLKSKLREDYGDLLVTK